MEKKEKQEEKREYVDNSRIIKVEVNDEVKKSFIAYAMAVNVSRAIPDVRDGLKPVHRRILYAMGELNLSNEKPYRKCARIVGDVLGKYHPHGDSAVYEALVRLAQDFSIRCPLVDGQGNFGSVDGDPAAAQRYTEARLSKIAGEMLRDIDKDTVGFYPNFDGTLQQPSVLPSRFPNLLVNGADGIAVGMATNIPPHNLGEVIDGVVALIDNPDIDIDELIKIIPGPDYPTKGIIMGRAGVRQAYKTGRGGIVVRAKTEIEENEKTGRERIIVTELPYQVNKAKLIEQMANLVKDKKIEGISDLKEESDRDGMRIVIEVKKDANAHVVLNTLFKHTPLQMGSGIIFLALVDGQPKIVNLKEMLFYYLQHQREVVARRTKYDLEKAQEREHILKGLCIALENVDEVIKVIKKAVDKNDACIKLCERFLLSEKQANAILEMRLQRLTSMEVHKVEEELAELEKTIAELKDILSTPAKIDEVVRREIIEIKEKYNTPRQTEISVDYGDIDIEDLVEREDIVVSLTHFGYIKRQPISEYKAQRRGGVGIASHKTKEEDFVETMFTSSTHDDLLFFTSLGKVYCKKAYEVPEAGRQAKGRAIINLLQLGDGESVTNVIRLQGDEKGNLVMATKQGLIKKTSLEEFAKIRKVGKIAIKLNEDDRLISVGISNEEDEIIVASHNGKCIRFKESDVREMGRDTQGVRSLKLDANDYIVDMVVVREGSQIFTISENGFGKRSDVSDYRLQIRGGKGIKAGVFNAKTGCLVNLKQVDESQDIIIIADNGTIIRLPATEVSKIGRDTLGVRVMRIKGGDYKVVCASVAEHEEEVEESEEDLTESLTENPTVEEKI